MTIFLLALASGWALSLFVSLRLKDGTADAHYAAAALGLAVLLVLVLAGCGDEYEHGAGVYPQHTQTVPATPVYPSEAGRQQPRPPSEGTELQRLTPAQRVAVDRATAAAREFLSGYVPYMYGRYPAQRIRRTRAGMRRKLEREAPRVTADMARARPELRALDLSGFQRGRVILLARVADGRTTYPVVLTLQRVHGRWIVIEVR